MSTAFRALQDWASRATDLSHVFALRRAAAPSHAARPELRRLPGGGVIGFAVAGRARVTCLGGEIWVTGPDTGDEVLSAGKSLSVSGEGRVVVEALRDARFVILR